MGGWKMKEAFVLTFDIGTQSARGAIVSKTGSIVAFEQIVYVKPYLSPEKWWAEQEPNFYYKKICAIAKMLKEKHSESFNSIAAVTITSFRDSVLCLDKDKNPLRNIILWLDKRKSEAVVAKIPFLFKVLLSIIRLKEIFSSQIRLAPCNWIKENEKDIWEKTDKYVMLPTYINYLLTGNLIDSVANMIGYIPMDYKNRRWNKSGKGVMNYIADIPKKMLVELCEPGDIIGHITQECFEQTGIPVGIPLIATGSDKSCETLGTSVIGDGQLAVSLGTTVTLQVCRDKYFTPAPFTPSYPSVYKKSFNGEIQIQRGYWMLTWFKREFVHRERSIARKQGMSVEALLSKRLFEIPAGCDGLILQPYWGSGVLTPHAKGAIIGFSDIHTKLHVFKSIIEGIGFAMVDGMRILEKRTKIPITSAYLSGGGSQSDEICQIMADIGGVPIHRMQTHEVGAIGSSMVAFVSLGIHPNYEEAIKNMCHITRTFTPNMNDHIFYKKIYKKIYVRVFHKLEPLYKRIMPIMKERFSEHKKNTIL